MNNLKFRVWESAVGFEKFYYDMDELFKNPSVIPSEIFNGEDKLLIINQWSGLKDRNGKDVYSGDIVQEQLIDGVGFCGQIYFAAGTFMIDGDGPLYDHTHSLTPDILEDYLVVGNIYENKELLA